MIEQVKNEFASVNAVYLAALTQKGPEILDIMPKINLPEKSLKELAFKSIPMGGKDGDSISISIANFQAITMLNVVPKINEESGDTRDTFVALGILLNDDINPIPYRNILRKIVLTCKENNILCYDCLKKISTGLIKSMTITQETSFTIEVKKGLKIEFAYLADEDSLDDDVSGMLMNIDDVLFQAVLSLEETMTREKSAFVLDKTILKAICSEGPLSLEDLRKKTLALESVLGVKIDLPMIKKILEKYIKEGIIKTIEKV